MPQIADGNKALTGLIYMSGGTISKVAELQLMMILIQTDRQHPKLLKLAKVREIIHYNCHSTVCEVAEEVSISKTVP